MLTYQAIQNQGKPVIQLYHHRLNHLTLNLLYHYFNTMFSLVHSLHS